MAKKRMFSLGVLETDAFLDMPLSAQALYFHLNLRADDDGFVGNPKRITQSIGANLDDLKLLVAKRFLIAFEDGVIVIKHWRMHNAIKKDRYTETNFTEDLKMLDIKENGAYTLKDAARLENKWSANGTQMEQTCSADKIRLDKVKEREEENSKEKTDTIVSVQKKKSLIESEFEEIWTKYPKKNGKQNALRDYIKARKSGVNRETIESGLDAYIDECSRLGREKQFIADGSTWFHQCRWDWDYSAQPVTGKKEETMEERIERWRREGLWDHG